jgi:Tol biopolymer transport system component
VHDRQTGATVLISRNSAGIQGDGGSINPAISGDGRYVVFSSASSNFGADTNGNADVFLHDRQTGQTTLIGVNAQDQEFPLGTSHPTISRDGRRVVFQQNIANQFPTTNNIFMRDLVSGEHVRLNPPMDGIGGGIGTKYAAISANGNAAAYQSDAANLVQGDSNQRTDIFAFALPGQSALPGDTNGDGQVNVDDLVAVILSWGPCPTSGACDADVNGSGVVDIDDLIMIILNWQA